MNKELRLAEILVELELVEKEIREREKTDSNEDWYVFCNNMQDVWDKHAKLKREKRMIITPEFNEIPRHAHVMTLKDFIENVKSGGFIDDDGFGSYVRDGKESDINIHPSDIQHGAIRDDFDSVAWYNK